MQLMQIEDIRRATAHIFKKYNIERAYLFGSYAKGGATSASDVDIRVVKGAHSKLTGLFSLASFEQELRDALRTEVDVVTYVPGSTANMIFQNDLKQSEVPLYDARG
ncbi:hypothetical protein TAMA11512_01990 [Selenomonas sp. TAMA-11512]|uniref:nucleotidyltransferase family protein n=1 Tax=Selenomonas sp. TAMA-11512 TaxID=3095337 RepID=UPI003090E7C1|nr:hypothetical protein TAMA11512_01990 [Selenomonas sp. TAMA-11512]